MFDGWSRLIEQRFLDDAPSKKDNGPRLEASRTFQRILGGDVDPETRRAVSGLDLFTMTSEDPQTASPILERPIKVFPLAMPDLAASMTLWKHFHFPNDLNRSPINVICWKERATKEDPFAIEY